MKIGFDVSPLLVRSAGVAVYQHNLARALTSLVAPDELRFIPVDLPRGLAYHRRLLEGKRGEVDPLSARLPGLWLSASHFFRVAGGGRWFEGCEVVHLAELQPRLSRGVRVVSTLHDLAVLRHPQFFSPRLVTWQREKLAYLEKRADRFLAVSHSVAQELQDDLGVAAERIAVVPHGVSEIFFEEVAAERRAELLARHQIRRPFVLFVGTVEPRKNLPALWQALQLLEGRLPPLQWVIAGHRGWKCAPLWSKLRREERAGRVRLCGGVDGEMLRALYQEALALVYPSFYEGFGLPVLEALASGAPVVTTPVPAARELAADAVLFADPSRPDTIAEALRRLWYEDALRRELSARGVSLARRLTWRRCAERTVECYRG